MIFPLEYYLEEDDADNFRRRSRYSTLLGHCADDFLVGVRKKSRESTWLSLTRQMSRMPPNRSLGPKSYARYHARTFWEGFCRGSGALDNSIIPGHPADDFLIKV